MTNKEKDLSPGQQLIQKIKEKKIIKDYIPESGVDFHGGYEDLYFYKFKQYLSSVSRYIMNKQLKDIPYNG